MPAPSPTRPRAHGAGTAPVAGPDAVDLLRLVAAQAARSPSTIAVEMDGTPPLGYAGLLGRVGRLAVELRGRGIGANVPVAIVMDRSPGMVVAVLAVLAAGGAYVPVDPAYPPARRRFMLEDSKARLALTDPALASSVGLPADRLLVVDRETADGAGVAAVDPASAHPGSEDRAYVIYTSGSTGQPKGVEMPHRALRNLIAWQIRREGFAPGARVLQFASLSFDVSFQEIFSTLASGGTLVLIDDLARRDPVSLLERLIDGRVARLFLPFVALRALADSAVARGRFPRDLREVYTAGEQLQVDDTLRRFFSALPACRLENQYGPSETHVVTAHRLGPDPRLWPTLPPIGAPIDHTGVAILDPARRPSGPGARGELWIRGVCLARGYAGRPELTSERFVTLELPGAAPEVYYRSGDIAEWDGREELLFHGRIDQQVKFRGHRIEPAEVAAQVAAHPQVAQCVVSLRRSDGLAPRLVAYVLLREGATATTRELHAFAAERLPAQQVPSQFVRMDAFPLTPSGKVDLRALPEPLADRSLLAAERVPPRAPDELALARIWSRVLGFDEVGVRDDFFELGGDSLLAAAMLEEVRRAFGRVLTLGALAGAPTIEGLAALLREGAAPSRWRSLVPIRPQGSRTPLFCVHGGLAGVGSFPLLARQLHPDQPFYGLQWDGLTGDGGARTVREMARRYLAEVRDVQPAGPYLLAGHCIGGLVAWEMARQLRAVGEAVAHLFLLDSPNLGSPHYRPGPIDPPWKVILRMKKDRRALAEVWLRRTLGLGVRPEHRTILAARVMIRAAWTYRPACEAIDASALVTGLEDGRIMNLAGSWTDGAMGWTAWAEKGVRVMRLHADHNEIVGDAATAEILEEVLKRFHQRAPFATKATGAAIA